MSTRKSKPASFGTNEAKRDSSKVPLAKSAAVKSTKLAKPSRLDALLGTSVSILIQGPGPIDAILPKLKRALPRAEWADLRADSTPGSVPQGDVVVLLGLEVPTASRSWLEGALAAVRVIAVSAGTLDESVQASFGTVLAATAAVSPSRGASS
ncbi:MAG: hypothetical protein HY791_23625 [Deltaproteobacteria bacterium]|nr:hypothetical protein [Deltaproteobacteria bacterium]